MDKYRLHEGRFRAEFKERCLGEKEPDNERSTLESCFSSVARWLHNGITLRSLVLFNR